VGGPYPGGRGHQGRPARPAGGGPRRRLAAPDWVEHTPNSIWIHDTTHVPEGWRLVGPSTGGIDLANAYLGHLLDRNYSPRTVRAYAFDLLHFVRRLRGEGVGIDAVTTDVLVRYLAACRQALLPGQHGGNVVSIRDGRSAGYAPATINRRLAAVSGLFGFRAMRDPSAASPALTADRLLTEPGSGPRRSPRCSRWVILGWCPTAFGGASAVPRPKDVLRVRQRGVTGDTCSMLGRPSVKPLRLGRRVCWGWTWTLTLT